MALTLVHTLRPDGLPYLKHVYTGDAKQGLCGSTPYEGQGAPVLPPGEAYPGCPECMDIFMRNAQAEGTAMLRAVTEEHKALREVLESMRALDLTSPTDRARMSVSLTLMASKFGDEDEADGEVVVDRRTPKREDFQCVAMHPWSGERCMREMGHEGDHRVPPGRNISNPDGSTNEWVNDDA